MLMSAALVLMVCVPGLALFYGGIAPEDHAGSSGEARALGSTA
jgi:ammonia channel protein AmtB